MDELVKKIQEQNFLSGGIEAKNGKYLLYERDIFFSNNNSKKIICENCELEDLVLALSNTRDFDLVSYPKEASELSFVEKNGIKVIENLGYIPKLYSRNEYLFNYCMDNNKYEYLLQFKDIEMQKLLVNKLNEDKEFNDNICDTISEIFDKVINHSLENRFVYEDSSILLLAAFEWEEVDALNLFSYKIDSSFDEILSDQNISINSMELSDDFVKQIAKLLYIPGFLRNNNNLFNKLLQLPNEEFKKEKNRLLVEGFNDTFFTDDIAEKYFDLFIPLEWIELKLFSNSKVFLKKTMEYFGKDYIQVDLDTFTKETVIGCLDTYYKEIVEILNETKKMSNYISDDKFFLKAIRELDYETLKKRSIDSIPLELVNKYPKIMLIAYEDRIIEKFQDNKALFKACFECESFYYIFQFDKSLITKEFIETYYDEAIKILTDKEKSTKLRSNNLLLEIMLDKKEYKYLNFFSSNAFNNISDDKYFKDISMYCNFNKELLEGTKYSDKFFEYCLATNDDLLENFEFTKEIENIIKNNKDKIIELCKKTIPKFIFSSTTMLKHYIENNDKDMVLKFDYKAINDLDDSLEDIKYLDYIDSIIEDKLPFYFSASFRLLKYYTEKRDFKYLEQFDKYAFGIHTTLGFDIGYIFYKEERKYFKKNIPLYMEQVKDGLPENFKNVPDVLDYYIDNNIEKYIMKFSSLVYDEKYFFNRNKILDLSVNCIDNYENGVIPPNILSSKFNELTIPFYLREYAFENKRYDFIEQFHFKISNIDELKGSNDLDLYEQVLGINKEEIISKIEKLYEHNDEILNTLSPFMLKKKFECFRFEDYEKICIYPDLQTIMYRLDEKNLKLISKIMPLLDSEEYDLSGILVKILKNIDNYSEIINNIDIENINEVDLKRLITVMKNSNNIYGIKTKADFDNYEEKINMFYDDIKNKIKDNNIKEYQIKEAIFMIRFGLDMDEVKFIIERYCHEMNSIKESKIDKKIYHILKSINDIYNLDNLEELKYMYISSKRKNFEFYESTALESLVRKEFAKQYNKTLYKVKDEHILNENHELYQRNKEVYDLMMNSEYNGKTPKFVIMDGDFNLQIHALGAYRDWDVPENFKEDWLRPKITYHGICTSYIGNNQIANARASHPIYGFDSYEDSALLCAGNYDLFSDSVISKYDTGYGKPYTMFAPKQMIDNTRHTHNEMVIERRSIKRGKTYKRLPSYVVYLVDDINNKDNFSNDNSLYKEVLQASIDQDIPILVVDRLKYAKLEKDKCNKTLEEFYNTKNYSLLSEYVLSYCNNMIGCTKFESTDEKEYHTIFCSKDFSNNIDDILNNINKNFSIEEQAKTIIELVKSIDKEIEKGVTTISSSYLREQLVKLGYNIVIEVEEKKSNNINTDLMNKISNFYYNSDINIQNQITYDIENNLSYEEIYQKIMNGIYTLEEKEQENGRRK